MKRVLHLVVLLFISINLFAQAPQKMTYQAVIRNASNNLVVSSPVKMKISILQGSASGTAVYSELHNPTTNANGLATIEIGSGTSQVGSIGSINWGNGTYFLKTETDPTNGSNLSIVGTSQLLSVPYALFSNNIPVKVSSIGDTLTIGLNKILIPGISNANPSITDLEGNTYPVITIGTQIWMAENLRTTKFNDGTDIPLVTDNTQWSNNFNNSTFLPMMCWYNNDQVTYSSNKYGALYNWYAINPTTNGNKNICPSGWHVPTDAEFTTLTNFLGGEAIAGGKMKTSGTLNWLSPNTGANNSSGFSGLPGGYRTTNGSFVNSGLNGTWWSSTSVSTLTAMFRFLDYLSIVVSKEPNNKANGFSIRCIKD